MTVAADASPASPPRDDKRWRQVDVRIRRLGARPDGLIEVLHTVQEVFGFLDDDALTYVSEALGVPPSRVLGVATFYSHFVRKPQGEHTCVVCMGTACYINGAGAIFTRLHETLGIEAGGTTPDNRISLLRARCLGACSMAPAVVVDDEVHGRISPDSVEQMLEAL
jgi:bidirectional [NiFe] hydrogenase diaphorase subunit